MRRAVFAAALVIAAGSAVRAQPAGAHGAAAASRAHGLIVKLRAEPGRAHATAAGAAAAPAAEAAAVADAAGRAERVRRVLAAAGIPARPVRAVGRDAQLVEFGAPLEAAQAEAIAARLRQRAEVEWVVPNERERRLQVPIDPFFAASAFGTGQWWLRLAGGSSANAMSERMRGVPDVQSAWARSTGSAAAVVAVLDTGITAHPDLSPHVLPGYDFVSVVEYANDGDGRDADPSDPGDWVSQADKDALPAVFGNCDVEDSSWHGTSVAGIVAAVSNNGYGVAAVNWNGRVLPVRVAGKCGAEVADIVDGMRWAAGLPVAGAPANTSPARIINISFGGSAACNAAYQEAIDELRTARGAVVVAAVGNGGGAVRRPASCAGVIGVAALNRDGFKASYSNFGPTVAVAGVGGDPTGEGAWGALLGDDGVLTVDNFGVQGPSGPSFGRQAGTSFATPLVAGVASLMLSVNPSLSAAQLFDGLRLSARPHVRSSQMDLCSAASPGRCICTTATCGAGILDAPQALAYAADPAAYVAPARLGELIDSTEVAAAVALGPDQPPQPEPTPSGGGGGGGSLDAAALAAMTLLWLALLAPAGRRRVGAWVRAARRRRA